MKKILIINGHPDKESFNYGISNAYKIGAVTSGAEVKEINIRELDYITPIWNLDIENEQN